MAYRGGFSQPGWLTDQYTLRNRVGWRSSSRVGRCSARSMRLLVVSPAPLRGGAEEYAFTLAISAKARGWRVVAALPEADGTRSLVRDLQDGGIPVRALPCIDPWEGGRPPTVRELWSATQRTARILRGVRADVVHVTLAWPSFGLSSLLAPAILNVPAVVVFQLVPEQVWLPWPRAVYRATRRRHQRWVAVSQHGQRVIASAMRLPAQSIDHIPNGVSKVDSPAMDPDARTRTRAAVRSELGLPANPVVSCSQSDDCTLEGPRGLCRAAAPCSNVLTTSTSRLRATV